MRNSQDGASKQYNFQREDALQNFMINRQAIMRKTRRRFQQSRNKPISFSKLHHVILNKGKKHSIQQQRNTQIQKNNRMLQQKIMKLQITKQKRSIIMEKSNSQNHHKRKKRSIPTLFPTIDNQTIKHSVRLSRVKNNSLTLFMGHSIIDTIHFKIKILISDGVYYLIAQNQQAKIVLQMPQQQYWKLHEQQFDENPCNIFKYLKIDRGKISFRVRNQQKNRKKQTIPRLSAKKRQNNIYSENQCYQQHSLPKPKFSQI